MLSEFLPVNCWFDRWKIVLLGILTVKFWWILMASCKFSHKMCAVFVVGVCSLERKKIIVLSDEYWKFLWNEWMFCCWIAWKSSEIFQMIITTSIIIKEMEKIWAKNVERVMQKSEQVIIVAIKLNSFFFKCKQKIFVNDKETAFPAVWFLTYRHTHTKYSHNSQSHTYGRTRGRSWSQTDIYLLILTVSKLKVKRWMKCATISNKNRRR